MSLSPEQYKKMAEDILDDYFKKEKKHPDDIKKLITQTKKNLSDAKDILFEIQEQSVKHKNKTEAINTTSTIGMVAGAVLLIPPFTPVGAGVLVGSGITRGVSEICDNEFTNSRLNAMSRIASNIENDLKPLFKFFDDLADLAKSLMNITKRDDKFLEDIGIFFSYVWGAFEKSTGLSFGLGLKFGNELAGACLLGSGLSLLHMSPVITLFIGISSVVNDIENFRGEHVITQKANEMCATINKILKQF